MYTALYRAKRPEVFDEILGQQHIVKILRHQIATNTVSHAYLFCGTRGTGKTTTARILAKAVNCLSDSERPCGKCSNCMSIKDGSFMDVIEIDAASNNGVDNIRELRESVKYPPAVGRKKVYIIDEVHMLSSGAFNALLKTLEEPPENVMFILATTEPQKLPATILSRCMRLDFKRVAQSALAEGMRKICEEKGVNISESALLLLANCADGSVRDGLSILDQVLASGEKNIDRDDVLEYVGTAGEDFFIELTELVSLRKTADALVLLDSVLAGGKDVKQMMKDWTAHYRNLLITKFIKNPEEMLNMSAENIAKVQEQSRHISLEEIENAVLKLSKTINDAKWSTQPRVLMELAIVAIASEFVEAESPAKRRAARISPAQEIVRPKQEELYSKEGDSNQGYTSQDIRNTQQAQSTTNQPQKNGASGGCTTCSAGVEGSPECDALWHRVFEEGEDEAGSFNLIRSGTRLIHADESTFTVVAGSDFTKKYVEQKRRTIEKIMSEICGRSMRMNCYCRDELSTLSTSFGENEEKLAAMADEELAQKASDILGMELSFVPVQDRCLRKNLCLK